MSTSVYLKRAGIAGWAVIETRLFVALGWMWQMVRKHDEPSWNAQEGRTVSMYRVSVSQQRKVAMSKAYGRFTLHAIPTSRAFRAELRP